MRSGGQRTVDEAIVGRYFPDHTEGRDYPRPTPAHLETTTPIQVEIEEWSARCGPADLWGHSMRWSKRRERNWRPL